MAIRVHRDIKEGQILITISEAVKLQSELINDKDAPTLVQKSELQRQIEARGIKTIAFSDKEPLYASDELKIPSEALN